MIKKLNRSFLCAIFFCPLLGYGIDLLPTDLVAPLPDKRFVQLGYLNTENTTYYRNGSVVSTRPYANPEIDGQRLLLRLIGTYTLADLPAVSYIQLPYGNNQVAGSMASLPSSTGIGDLTLVTAIWPYANRENRTYFGVGGFLTIPTNYHNTQSFNIGENRYRTSLQMGLQKAIVGNLDGMIAFDTTWFGGNSDCAAACGSTSSVPLNQKPLSKLQLGPSYKINQTFTVGASYLYVTGGATEINNVYQNNVTNTQRFLLSAIADTTLGRLTVQYGRDMAIENGFFQTRLLSIRYTVPF
jgi:hypothetical protein